MKKKYPALKPGILYRFMNCDTGRLLRCKGVESYKLIESDGAFALMDPISEKYLHIAKNGNVSLASKPFGFRFCLDNDYLRYQILEPDGKFLYLDDDSGDTSDAAVAIGDPTDRDIRTGWYAVAENEPLPKRFAAVGDSVTEGCAPDDPPPHYGCRKVFSELIIHAYGRAVFTGSQVPPIVREGERNDRSTIDEPYLYRHQGHSGWVISRPEGFTGNLGGINMVRPNLQKKYTPDIILLGIGANDVGEVGTWDVTRKKATVGCQIFARWTKLVCDFLYEMPKDGKLLIAEMTPFAKNNPEIDQGVNEVNAVTRYCNLEQTQIAEALATLDPRIALCPLYDGFRKLGKKAISHDCVHPTALGYSLMGELYFDAVKKVLPLPKKSKKK